VNAQFLELLQVMQGRFALALHAFVLTGNLYRLQIETLRSNLSLAVYWLTCPSALGIIVGTAAADHCLGTLCSSSGYRLPSGRHQTRQGALTGSI
jgi:hypothetical protein